MAGGYLWYEKEMERDGDGWLDCTCGSRHWGRFGAAGLLLIDPTSPGSVLLQLRAEWSHNGGTWGVPGGARDSHETPVEAALREAAEELGIDTAEVRVIGEHGEDHGNWRYDTILAKADPTRLALVHNRETTDAAWFTLDDVSAQLLHHAFAAAWPTLRDRIAAELSL